MVRRGGLDAPAAEGTEQQDLLSAATHGFDDGQLEIERGEVETTLIAPKLKNPRFHHPSMLKHMTANVPRKADPNAVAPDVPRPLTTAVEAEHWDMAAALVRFLQQQYIRRDGVEHRLIHGVFGIFGGDPDRAARIEIARRHANAETRGLIANERLFR